ncbi:MAG: CoA-acylating methylmalonate-semialdehyde dehydrogenase [Holophagaceae bacterium]|nr:CoA-acylating methylmalonate-semialdehyde dehydrogenase [Holophagaceae bacterium]
MSDSERVRFEPELLEALNLAGGRWEKGGGAARDLLSPWTGQRIGRVFESTAADVDRAVQAAVAPGRAWGLLPLKERTQVMFRFREALMADLDRLAHSVAAESGKLPSEGRAGVMKGIEVLEFALSLQNLDDGAKVLVSSGVTCEVRREPLGVVAGVTPFNFPAMVPLWMIPIALTVGNAFVWKPSDKTPLTSLLIAEGLRKAGLPDGVFSVVQGGKEAVDALCDHPGIAALAFVGSTPVAKAVYTRATASGKRALCLGGAKNHIILMPDADPEIAASGILASFTGCAGQRCMASSVLLAVGNVDPILEDMAARAKAMVVGADMGALISKDSKARLDAAIAQAAGDGADVKVDGRTAQPGGELAGGNWLGPTILDRVQPGSPAACDELFGPVLSVVRVPSLDAALAIEAGSPYGNAASVFTRSGAVAEEVANRAHAGMIGVNIGVPVPREPFSFGGFQQSRFGSGDITGQDGVAFWSQQKKVTLKWAMPKDMNWMS